MDERNTPKWVLALSILVALILVAGAFGHIMTPEVSDGMIPGFIPKTLAHAIAVVVELGIAGMVLHPRFRSRGLLAFSILMILFLPIHIIDAFRDQPVVGSQSAAWIRIGVQMVFIWLGRMLARKSE